MISIYVGNLPYAVRETDLIDLFTRYGGCIRATIVTDRETGRSRGYGFVEMQDPGEGRSAIAALAGQPFMGRPLTVNEARPRGSGTGQRVMGDGTGSVTAKPAADRPLRHRDDHARRDRDVADRQRRPAAEPAGEVAASTGYHNRLRQAVAGQ